MADADSILQGVLIGSFGFIGVVSVVYCLKKKAKSYSMKKSASMEELSSVDTTDPTQTQDEERYALPPVLVTIASPRMGSSFVGR
jgi:hypothetical protein